MRTPIAFLLCLLATVALAEVGPAGSEFQVNTYTTNDQFAPRVGADAGGNFVVVWESGGYYGAGVDGSSAGLGARRFDAAGIPQGPEFVVNTFTSGPQQYPRIATRPSGDFVVAWQGGDYYVEQDGSLSGAFLQRFASGGARLGGERLVNTTTAGSQLEPVVAVGPAGDALVVWTGFPFSLFSPGDGDSAGLFAQRYDATGAPVGGEFQVNTYTTGRQEAPAVAADAAGGFVVVWQSGSYYGSAGQDGSAAGIFGQRFDATGAPRGGEFQVNTYTTGRQLAPAVAIEPGGGFVVVWQSGSSYGTDGPDGSLSGVFGRAFDVAGVPTGGEFQVNSYTSGSQDQPDVASDGDGNVVVAWTSGRSGFGNTQDGSQSGVFARHLTSLGDPIGPEFQVNTYTIGAQRTPAISVDSSGTFVVVWASGYNYGFASQDGDGSGIFGRRLRITAFEPPRPRAASKLALRASPTNPRSRRLSLRSSDAGLGIGLGADSRDDPTLDGGTLRLRSAGFDATYPLPAHLWRRQGTGWSYRDAGLTAGPITKIVLRPGSLRVSGKGAGLVVDLGSNPDPVEVVVQIGARGLRQCVRLGGSTSFKPERRFRAADAAAPPSCAP